MDSDSRTPVVLFWHMHQPGYQDCQTGQFQFPWVYLHTIKDYSDMAAHLEAHPNARAVVNFAPILLEQIETYLVHIERWRHGAGEIGDPLLAALVAETLPEPGSPGFLDLMEKCLRANQDRIINRFPAYARLAELAGLYRKKPAIQRYMSPMLLTDLLVWYHLGWMGETIRRENHCVQSLQEKGGQFSWDDRCALMEVIFEILAGIGPRYRHLAQIGQVELSVSPYTHSMLPLLIELASAREAMPEIVLPAFERYPGGDLRVAWQLEQAKRVFRRFFSVEPTGCWASEGGLSQATLAYLDAHGFSWTASGDSVIRNSIHHARTADSSVPDAGIHRPYRFGDTSATVFFRDDGLSDLIGFTYADWHASDAVGDLVHHMENIAAQGNPESRSVISVILDGENAWEYYPENGFHFLDELYEVLENHPALRLTTYRDLVADPVSKTVTLPHLVAGSWIYGTFSTWIGDPDKNRAWELLCEAKCHYDRLMDNGSLNAEQKEAAQLQLAICEGSDWFWWFGDYNPAQIVSDFEHLYRKHLVNLYDLIGYPAPASVFQQLSQGSGAPERGGTMRPGHDRNDNA
ncbi:glycoside hydrolase family 57 protein [Marinobacter sp. M216]|uniref:Glycoside hydrolase family 57 protein n=1 Tax=Marinobacter albus TaxID=3030833 RepID=A0ABT7HEF1_9GAMM|nr:MULTISPECIES: glycoside hydrolase family 57 protein [unclassified Marinobacter]MBW7469865.1 glycoside hydrolase [Marinobacter sp. F4218]MDK9557875.1 glycoside hydrolase family 57 protein [Marinobacter sp. M216]